MTTQNTTLSNLIPFADYRLSVKCIPILEHTSTADGYWSKTVYTMFTTQPDGMRIVLKHCM